MIQDIIPMELLPKGDSPVAIQTKIISCGSFSDR